MTVSFPSRPFTQASAVLALLVGATAAVPVSLPSTDPCVRVARDARKSCREAAQSDFWLARANCNNIANAVERAACAADAWEALDDALDQCDEQHQARLTVCCRLGGGVYAPEIDPEDFVPQVDNPWLPRLPGMRWSYAKTTPAGLETTEIVVTNQTKLILGVACTVVHSIERINGVIKEDTDDWVAQDEDGNVWYFGEHSKSYEDGVLAGLDGSWMAGENGAQPGILMRAAPSVGETYRQEFLLAEAEDLAGVLALSVPVSVPYGTFANCLKTEEFTPLEPDVLEHKFYLAGVGFVLAINVGSGSRTELVSFTMN